MDVLNPVAILQTYVILWLGPKWRVPLIPVKPVTMNSLHNADLLWELISKTEA